MVTLTLVTIMVVLLKNINKTSQVFKKYLKSISFLQATLLKFGHLTYTDSLLCCHLMLASWIPAEVERKVFQRSKLKVYITKTF